ncbi:hypothetical protein D3C79_820210 [compost metagenome]
MSRKGREAAPAIFAAAETLRTLQSHITRLGRTRQAIHIDPPRPGLAQHLGDSLRGGTGGQHIIDNGDMLVCQFTHCRKRLAQIAPPCLGIQLLLRRRLAYAHQQPFVATYPQLRRQPAPQHPGLVEPPLAQSTPGQGHRQQQVGPG